MIHTYAISGMTCTSCVARVKSAILKMPDVLAADVQLAAPQATITMSRHIATSALQQAVSSAGNYIITPDGELEQPMNEKPSLNAYFPVLLILAYIAGAAAIVEIRASAFSWMRYGNFFMAGFFLVFSFFKLMNLQGFADGYRTYDIVARRWPVWGIIYPWVELGLGIAFLAEYELYWVNLIALVIMGIGSIGVLQAMVQKRKIQCACLGTVIRLPLGSVSLLEDLLMVAMSATMVVAMS